MVIQTVVDMTQWWAQMQEYLGVVTQPVVDMTKWEAQTEEYLLSGDTNCGGHDTVVGTNGRVFAVW